MISFRLVHLFIQTQLHSPGMFHKLIQRCSLLFTTSFINVVFFFLRNPSSVTWILTMICRNTEIESCKDEPYLNHTCKSSIILFYLLKSPHFRRNNHLVSKFVWSPSMCIGVSATVLLSEGRTWFVYARSCTLYNKYVVFSSMYCIPNYLCFEIFVKLFSI